MTDGVGELCTVQGIEMEFLHAMPAQALHLFYRDVGRDHPARLRVLIQAVEPAQKPRRAPLYRNVAQNAASGENA